jgi:uncharacterized protein YggE
MNRTIKDFFLSQVVLSIVVIALPMVLAQGIRPTGDVRQWIIESEGAATASPDVVYLMMKMEYQAATAADAIGRGERQLSEFLAAVDNLKIPNLTYRVRNTVITPGGDRQGTFSGFVYTRNIVFTIGAPQLVPMSNRFDRTIAQVEDLGARHNSHCVTCVGSG